MFPYYVLFMYYIRMLAIVLRRGEGWEEGDETFLRLSINWLFYETKYVTQWWLFVI